MLNYFLDPPGVGINVVKQGSELPAIKNLPVYTAQIGLMNQSHLHFTERIEKGSIFQIMVTKSGCGSITHLGNTITLNEGQMCVVDFNRYHHYQAKDPGGWSYYFIWVRTAFCSNFVDHLYPDGNFCAITPNRPQQVFDVISEIMDLFDRETVPNGIRVSELVYGLMMTMVHDRLITFSPDASGFTEKMPEIDQYIANNIYSKIKISDLAAITYMSERHFARKFTDYMGITPHAYISLQKIKEAKNMLSQSPLPVEAVAENLGYPSSSGFIKHFKSVTGVTPRQYRKNAMEPA